MPMLRFWVLILAAGLLAAAVPPTEPSPGPSWGVYLPLGPADNAGIVDPTKKCHWYEKLDANGDPVGGAWYTHLVFKDGAPITNNADLAIWNGDAVLYLRERPNNPQELEPVLEGAALTSAHGYGVMRMVLVRPGQDGMPPNPVQIGSPHAEPARRANEDRVGSSVPTAYWMAADEVSQGLWKQVMGDLHPVDPAAVDHDAALAAALAADSIGDVAAFTGVEKPSIYLAYNDSLGFCATTSAAVAATVRLPAEDEWEYACRAGRDTAFNTERGYTLGGPEWKIADTGSPPLLVEAEDYDDYFTKRKPKVNGSDTNNYPDPATLTHGMVYIAGKWVNKIRTVRFISEGAIDAKKNFTALAEVEANFDSRYRRWYHRVYQFAWLTHTQKFTNTIDVTTTAWFTVRPETILDPTPSVLTGPINGTTGALGMVAYDQRHLAELVQGLYVAVDASGSYTADETAIGGFRQVIDGVMPPGMTVPTGALVYYHQAEYDDRGIYLAAPLPDEETFFQEAEEDIAGAIAGLPLETWWESGTPKPSSTAAADLGERLSEALEKAKEKPQFAYVDWLHSTYDETFNVDLSWLSGKRGRYALRNRWGIANTHGNVAEWCVPGRGYLPARRWDGEAGYADPAGYGPGEAYAVIRGGSFQASADKCRSAVRSPAVPADRRPHIGFRFLIED